MAKDDKPEKPDLAQAVSGSPIVATLVALFGMIPHGRWLVFAALVVFGLHEAFQLYNNDLQSAARTAQIQAESQTANTRARPSSLAYAPKEAPQSMQEPRDNSAPRSPSVNPMWRLVWFVYCATGAVFLFSPFASLIVWGMTRLARGAEAAANYNVAVKTTLDALPRVVQWGLLALFASYFLTGFLVLK